MSQEMTMTPREKVENGLRTLPDVTIDTWKDTELVCVFYKGKEFAHFQDQQEIDVRLSAKFIRRHKLGPPIESTFHPDRSKNSRWRLMRFTTDQEVENLLSLIQTLLEEEYQSGWP